MQYVLVFSPKGICSSYMYCAKTSPCSALASREECIMFGNTVVSQWLWTTDSKVWTNCQESIGDF